MARSTLGQFKLTPGRKPLIGPVGGLLTGDLLSTQPSQEQFAIIMTVGNDGPPAHPPAVAGASSRTTLINDNGPKHIYLPAQRVEAITGRLRI